MRVEVETEVFEDWIGLNFFLADACRRVWGRSLPSIWRATVERAVGEDCPDRRWHSVSIACQTLGWSLGGPSSLKARLGLRRGSWPGHWNAAISGMADFGSPVIAAGNHRWRLQPVQPSHLHRNLLGLVGRRLFDQRTGRNRTFNSAGNVVTAILMGVFAYYLSNRGIFVLVLVLCVADNPVP